MIARRLLERALPGDVRDGITGDLDEVFRRDTGQHGAGLARRRYRRKAVSLACRFLVERLRDRLAPSPFIPTAMPAVPSTRGTRMASLLQDVTYAVRALRKAPGFSAVVIATLALGIGANTAIFSVVHAVVLSPLPYAQPEQLVRVTSELRAFDAQDTGVAPLELFDYQSRTDLFSGVAGLYPINANVTGGAEPERVEAMLVTWNYFAILGAAPELGRVFGPDDDGPGIPEVAVVSDAYWRRRLGADPGVIGRTLTIDGDPFVLVGVMPPDFRHPGRTMQTDVDLWAPAGYRALPFPAPSRRRFLEGALARLQPGVTLAQARERLDALGETLRREFPADYPASTGWRPLVVPLQDDVVGAVTAPMLILLGAVAFVLLIACANVANLMLTRASERQAEMAVRASLGATAGRLARQILTESAVLAVAGGLLGLMFASWGLRLLVELAPSRVPRLASVGLDGQALAVALGLSLLTTMLFGLAPALQMRRVQAVAAVRDSDRSRSGGPGAARVRGLLVAAEVAMAVVLLVGAGLLARSFWALQQVSIGFDTDDLLTARVWLPRPNDPANGKYLVAENRIAFGREALARLEALPGVERAAISSQIPMGGYNPPLFFEREGQAVDQAGRTTIHSFLISPGYFDTLGVPIVRGRGFTDFDRAGTDPVAIVSEAAVRQYWNGGNPVGSRIRLAPELPWLTVVGVAGDVRTRQLTEPAQPILYRPFEQASSLTLAFLIRTAGPVPGLGEAVAREVRAVDPDLPVYAVRTMNELLAAAVAQREFLMRVLGLFGAAAIGLALLGIYGVISYSVVQRTREIGIRVAIGARPGQVLALVLRQGLAHAIAGMAAGLVAALLLARLITSQLYGVAPFDPVTLAAVLALMAVAAGLAVAVPARRASRVDPIAALRLE
ncbi:MAG: ADOP family duplicated permease [Vicinamibacterales bacterium]